MRISDWSSDVCSSDLQTFDAVRVEYMGIKNLKVDLTYAIAARTIWGIDGGKFGSANRPTDIEGDDVFANISYKTKLGTLTGFAYLVDEDEAVVALRRNSSQTYGARFAGAVPFTKKVKLSYLASYARQSDYATNPVDYSADFVTAELGLDVAAFKLTGGYELLGSDGGATGIAGGFAFPTPFATLHKFNGWAAKLLTTPGNGLERKSVVEGKSVSVRIDLVGRRIMKKQRKHEIPIS